MRTVNIRWKPKRENIAFFTEWEISGLLWKIDILKFLFNEMNQLLTYEWMNAWIVKSFNLIENVSVDTDAVFRFLDKNTISSFPGWKADNLQAQLRTCKNAQDDTSFGKMWYETEGNKFDQWSSMRLRSLNLCKTALH